MDAAQATQDTPQQKQIDGFKVLQKIRWYIWQEPSEARIEDNGSLRPLTSEELDAQAFPSSFLETGKPFILRYPLCITTDSCLEAYFPSKYMVRELLELIHEYYNKKADDRFFQLMALKDENPIIFDTEDPYYANAMYYKGLGEEVKIYSLIGEYRPNEDNTDTVKPAYVGKGYLRYSGITGPDPNGKYYLNLTKIRAYQN